MSNEHYWPFRVTVNFDRRVAAKEWCREHYRNLEWAYDVALRDIGCCYDFFFRNEIDAVEFKLSFG